MRLSMKAMAITSAILWGGCLFIVGVINLLAPAYGTDFLRGMGSVYPGFYSTHTFPDVLLGTVYGFVDGLIGGWLFGWLYNIFGRSRQQSVTTRIDKAA